MRILILHSRYLSGDTSGENRVVLDEGRLLQEAGHEVTSLAPAPELGGRLAQARLAADAIWARTAARSIGALVRTRSIDVVHMHNMFPLLSPAALRSASAAGAAVVMTLHNYRLMCVSANLMREGVRCEDCVGRTPWPGVVHRCYRSSVAGSAALATSLTVHRSIRSFDRVDRFLAVSASVARQHVAGGLAEASIEVKENFAWPSPMLRRPAEHFVFVGRIAPEKGIDVLLRLWSAGSRIGRLLIVGDGPDLARLSRAAPADVRFVGAIPQEEVANVIARARAVLVPSRWAEPAVPKVVLEAYAAGVPVIASAVGAIPEGVEDGRTGFLVAPDDDVAWTSRLQALMDDELRTRFGGRAHQLWKKRFAPETGLHALEGGYERAIARSAPAVRRGDSATER